MELATSQEPIRVEPADFIDGGDTVDRVPVRISYGIIERFSEGLYSSPNKAFEELVSNAYDAGAQRVWIELPDDLSAIGSTIVVLDDGVSMDVAGLKELWQIGESPKRDGGPEGGERVIEGRLPIGKFGIGKLATFVLATKLTYICRREDDYLAVTMDFGRVEGGFTELQPFELDVVSLSADEARDALTRALSSHESTGLEAFFENEPEHWTAAVLTDLKDQGQNIELGRLKWILRTALPLSPKFALFARGTELKSSKANENPIWSFEVGKSDKSAALKKWRYKASCVTIDAKPAVRLTHAGVVTGRAELYDNSLQRGKSEQWGRSHGFFVKVRGRLINIDDELFGMEVELRHGTFTRFRMEVDADDLDGWVASPRESIQDSAGLKELRQYLLDVFNRARTALEEHEKKPDTHSLAAAERISAAPAALSQRPLRRLLTSAVEGEDQELLQLFSLTEPEDLEAAKEVLASDDNLLGRVEVGMLSDPHRLVGYDPAQRAIVVNSAHPFVRNYLGAKGATDVVRDIGAAELLTEAFLLDEDFPSSFVRRFLERRDALLRALTQIAPRSALVVAQQLRDSKNDEKALEDAVGDALELLGYEVQRISGNGKADGVASARLGKASRSGDARSYSFTYDAKSVRLGHKDAIKAGTARTSILRIHREAEDAEHTLLVAPDFEGGNDSESNLGKTCVNDSITPIRVADFARLVELFPFRNLSPGNLRPLFNLRLPKDCKEFVDELKGEQPQPPPVKVIFEVIAEFSLKQDAVSMDTINTVLNVKGLGDIGSNQVEVIVRGLSALAPRTMYFDGGIVSLNASPEAVLDELRETLDPLPPELVSSYREALGID